MSLDKQKILNELGSVVNQLQSAKCGCMNNLFENQNASPKLTNQMAPNFSNAGCRHSCIQNNNCCHSHYGQGHNFSNSNYDNCCTGYKTSNATPNCGGDMPNNLNALPISNNYNNPVKLYTDTYNYLNKNLVQPTIEEVYNDLKTITPENTVMNNPLAQKMGIPFQNQPNNHMGHATNQMNAKINNAEVSNNMGQLGMGPNIVNMMTTNNSNPSNNQTAVTETFESNDFNQNSNIKVQSLPNSNNPMTQTPTVKQFTAFPTSNQQMAGHNHYLTTGNPVENFNQMFPDIKNKFGDLGYDPMAIAIQMKTESANQENMQKVPQIKNSLDTHNINENINSSNVTTSNHLQMNNNNSKLLYGQTIEGLIPKQINNHTVNNNNSLEESTPRVLSNALPKADKFYNTLGQPVEILPADIYRLPRDILPQTLSPMPVPMSEIVRRNQKNASNYNNVKSTVSKTSIMGQNSTQLQHLYNHYKGSQSFTNQNIAPLIQKSTISEGQIYENKDNIEVAANNIEKPMEQAAGDTLLNNANAMNNNNLSTEKPLSRFTEQKIGLIKGRNGLQDVNFTSYPTTTSWSFHGGYNRPITPKYYGS